MNVVQKLRQLVQEIESAASPAHARASWVLAGRLLERMPFDRNEVRRVVDAQDVAGLDALVRSVEQAASGAAGAPEPAPAAGGADEPIDKEQAAALRAFRKRLKLARLAEESKLGGRQLTAGRRSEIDAIIPPQEYPREVWDALARAGKLKDTGQGFFSLP